MPVMFEGQELPTENRSLLALVASSPPPGSGDVLVDRPDCHFGDIADRIGGVTPPIESTRKWRPDATYPSASSRLIDRFVESIVRIT